MFELMGDILQSVLLQSLHPYVYMPAVNLLLPPPPRPAQVSSISLPSDVIKVTWVPPTFQPLQHGMDR